MPSLPEVGVPPAKAVPAVRLTLQLMPALMPAPLLKVMSLPAVRDRVAATPGFAKVQSVLTVMLFAAAKLIWERVGEKVLTSRVSVPATGGSVAETVPLAGAVL